MGGRSNRYDLSDWIIHFVHDRKEEDDLYCLSDTFKLETGKRMSIPSYFDENGSGIDLSDENADTEMILQMTLMLLMF